MKNSRKRRGPPGPPGPMGPRGESDRLDGFALGSFVRGIGEGLPKMFSHYGDIRREAWLTCMHAAAVWHATRGTIVSLTDVVSSADKLFDAAKERYPELANPPAIKPEDLK